MKLSKKFSSGILCASMLVLLSGCGVGELKEVESSEFTELIAIEDFNESYSNSEGKVGGSIFLFLGEYETEEGSIYKIKYAEKESNGVIYIRTIEVDPNSVGFMEDGTNKLETISTDATKEIFGSTMSYYRDDKYIFHIPEGSISKNIEIDLK